MPQVLSVHKLHGGDSSETRDTRTYTERYRAITDSYLTTRTQVRTAVLSVVPQFHPDDPFAGLKRIRLKQNDDDRETWIATCHYEYQQQEVPGFGGPFDPEIPPWWYPAIRSYRTIIREYPVERVMIHKDPVPVTFEFQTDPSWAASAGDSSPFNYSPAEPEDYTFYGYHNSFYWKNADGSTDPPNGGENAFVNTAGFPFDPPASMFVPHQQIIFRKAVQFYDDAFYARLRQSINAVAIGPYDVGTLMVMTIEADEVFAEPFVYHNVTIVIEHNPKYWYNKALNAGYVERVLNWDYASNNDLDQYIFRRIETSEPWPLDAEGKRIERPSPDAPLDPKQLIFVEGRVYKYYDFNRLGFRITGT